MIVTVLVCVVASLLVLSLIGLPFVVWGLLGLTVRNIGLSLDAECLR